MWTLVIASKRAWLHGFGYFSMNGICGDRVDESCMDMECLCMRGHEGSALGGERNPKIAPGKQGQS